MEPHPEVRGGELPHELERVELAEAEERLDGDEADVAQGHQGQPLLLAHGDVLIDGDLDQVRLGELRDGDDRNEDEGQEQPAPVGLDEAPDAGRQAGVVRLAEDLLLRHQATSTSTSSASCSR